MPKLPVVSGTDVIKTLANIGYELDHQTGSHTILRHREPPHRRITVPKHREVAKGTLTPMRNAILGEYLAFVEKMRHARSLQGKRSS